MRKPYLHCMRMRGLRRHFPTAAWLGRKGADELSSLVADF
jgi:hypothetical protein